MRAPSFVYSRSSGRLLLLVLLLIAVLAVGACSKSTTDGSSMPPGATKAETDGGDAASGQTGDGSDVDQEALAEQRRLEAERAAARSEEMKMEELATMVHYDFDSYELKENARDILKRKVAILKQETNIKLVVEGYCDERGTQEYNLALGERRARAAYEFLVLLGISPERLSIVSYGEEFPLDPASNEIAWAKNRRAQFRIVQ